MTLAAMSLAGEHPPDEVVLSSRGGSRRSSETQAFVPLRDVASATTVLADLTSRERDVLAEVGRGRINAEIAERLFISPLTAQTHVSRIMTKLPARDRSQLVVLAYETGFVTPGEGQPE